MCRDEALQIFANPLHDRRVSLHSRQQHASLERRDDEAREPRRVDVALQLHAKFPEQRLQLSRPLIEHLIESPTKPFMRIGELSRQIAKRRSIPPIALPLQRHQRIDEQREPVERLDHRLPENRQPSFGEPRELSLQHLVPQRLL